MRLLQALKLFCLLWRPDRPALQDAQKIHCHPWQDLISIGSGCLVCHNSLFPLQSRCEARRQPPVPPPSRRPAVRLSLPPPPRRTPPAHPPLPARRPPFAYQSVPLSDERRLRTAAETAANRWVRGNVSARSQR